MTDQSDFEDRLRATFQAEAAELARRQDRASSGEAVRSVALVEEIDGHGFNRDRRILVPLLAAAVLLLAGIAGVISLARSADDSIVPVAAVGPSRPLVTATPIPTPTITVVPTLIATPGSGAEDAIDEEPFLYVVQVGDALGLIAQRFNVTLESILATNPELDAGVLLAGQELLIPGANSPRPPLSTAVLVTPVPTAPPLPTVVPATPVQTSVAGFVVTEPLCLTRDVGWLPAGTCGLEVIGSIVGSQIPVQFVNELGQVWAGFAPVDGLVQGDAVPQALYQPGLIEDTWCVAGIFSPDTLNVRQGPSTDREIFGELREGQCGIYLTGVAEDPFTGWAPILVDRLEGPLVGWVADAYLRRDTETLSRDVALQAINVRIEPLAPGSDVPAVEFFEFSVGRTVFGKPNATGALMIPESLDPVGLVARAPVDGDPFCAWTGSLEATASDGYHVLRVAMLCA